MAEAGQGGHQLDVTGGAVGVQLQDVVGGEGGVVPPGLGQIPEQIGVLNVQLPLVDLVAAEQIRHPL